MLSQWMRTLLFPIVCAFITLSSFLLSKTPNILLLALTGLILIAGVIFERRHKALRYLPPLLLMLFHWLSHLNWSQILYIILIVLSFDKKLKMKQMLPLAIAYSLIYTAIRLSYLPVDYYNILVSGYDLIAFILVVLGFHYVHETQSKNVRLVRKNEYLITHDPLTGALNYEAYTKKVESLVASGTEFVLLLLDFHNFKSVNSVSIRNGNEVLTMISDVLKARFPLALAIARYAGDRFALVLPKADNLELDVSSLMVAEAIGYEVTFSLASFPSDAGDAQGIIAIAEDRLFQKKRKLWLKQEEEMFRSEKLMVVGELAAGMAHEIRNPLTTIQGFMQLSKHYDYSIKPWFDVIMSEIIRMSELTVEFLQFSKPHISNFKPEAVADCFERARMLTESKAVSYGHILLIEPADPSIVVMMDRNKIIQVLLNLIKNAMEAMDQPGNIVVLLKRENNQAVIEVRDNGPGIPEEVLGVVFNPFYSTKENGTGLGLSICYKIVQDHGGAMEVESGVNEGTTFRVKLPMFP